MQRALEGVRGDATNLAAESYSDSHNISGGVPDACDRALHGSSRKGSQRTEHIGNPHPGNYLATIRDRMV